MIHGVGTDIFDIKRIRVMSPNWDDPFFIKTFTENEREKGITCNDPARYFAKRFSGKEAVFKSLHILSNEIRLNEIEILNDYEGRPFVTLYGEAKRLTDEIGIKQVFISLSDDGDMVISFAVSVYAV